MWTVQRSPSCYRSGAATRTRLFLVTTWLRGHLRAGLLGDSAVWTLRAAAPGSPGDTAQSKVALGSSPPTSPEQWGPEVTAAPWVSPGRLGPRTGRPMRPCALQAVGPGAAGSFSLSPAPCPPQAALEGPSSHQLALGLGISPMGIDICPLKEAPLTSWSPLSPGLCYPVSECTVFTGLRARSRCSPAQPPPLVCLLPTPLRLPPPPPSPTDPSVPCSLAPCAPCTHLSPPFYVTGTSECQ